MAFLESAFSGDVRPRRCRKFASLIAKIVQLAFVMRRRPNPDSETNIRRIDTKKRARKQTHGFQVHFLRGLTAVTKMFSDSVYGGKEAARRAARKFRNSAIRRLSKAKSTRGRSTTKSRRKRAQSRRRPGKRRRR